MYLKKIKMTVKVTCPYQFHIILTSRLLFASLCNLVKVSKCLIITENKNKNKF